MSEILPRATDLYDDDEDVEVSLELAQLQMHYAILISVMRAVQRYFAENAEDTSPEADLCRRAVDASLNVTNQAVH